MTNDNPNVNQVVTLTISKNPGQGNWPPANYTHCKVGGADSQVYAYRFSGGNVDNNGAFRFQRRDAQSPPLPPLQVTINVTPAGYTIDAISITYDTSPPHTTADLSSAVHSPPDATATIYDTDLDHESGYYNVQISDTSDGQSGIVCDPAWQNEN